MRHPRLLIALLVLATVLVDLVLWSSIAGQPWSRARGSVAVWFFLPAGFAQTSLAAIWIRFARRWRPWTAMLLAAGILGWRPLLRVPEQSFSLLFWLFGIQAVMILAGLLLVQAVEIRLVASSPGAAMERPRLQFSLASMLSWITATAVVLGLYKWTSQYRYSLFLNLSLVICAGAIIASQAALALAALWAMLGTARCRLRIFALCIVASGAGFVWVLAFGDSTGDAWPATGMFLADTAWLVLSLAVVRVAGYRLVRCRGGAGNSLALRKGIVVS